MEMIVRHGEKGGKQNPHCIVKIGQPLSPPFRMPMNPVSVQRIKESASCAGGLLEWLPVYDGRTMMKAALLFLAAVFIGLFVAFLLVIAMEVFSSVVHPLPEDFGGTSEEMCRHVQRYPHWVLAVAVAAWAVAALVSTWIAQRIGNVYSSMIVGLLLLAALIFNISMLPYPIWFKIVNLLAIPTAIVAGSRLSRRLI